MKLVHVSCRMNEIIISQTRMVEVGRKAIYLWRSFGQPGTPRVGI